MEFIRKNTPKQFNRNGYMVGGGNYYSSSFTSNNSGGSSGASITNYLPAYLVDGYYQIINPIKFINYKGEWVFYKRTTTTDENGEANEVDTMVMSISPNAIKMGDGSEVITTKMFYLDDNGNLHTKYNIVSDGEIVAYVNGYSTNNGSGESGSVNISNVVIVDDLLSNLKDACLSANMGRVLNERINEINNNNHTHTNQNILDGITSTNITNWNNASNQAHTHGINKNSEVYNLIMGNYGGIKATDTDKHIMRMSDGNVTVNANGRHLYLGGDTTLIIYLPTYYDNGDDTTTAQWNSFNPNNLYLQMPLQVALQEHNNTQSPIKVNSTNLCNSLNADLLDGQHGSYYVNNVGVNGDNLTVTKGTTTTNFKPNFATKAQRLVDENNSTYISTWNKTVQIQGLNDSIYLGSQSFKNNNYSIYFVTNNGTADTEGVVFWNYINGTSLTTQVPHRIILQSTNNTEPPIYTNSTNLCTNLNANYVGGYKQEQLLKTSGDQTINGNITIKGNLIVEGGITATDEVQAYSSTLSTSLTTKIKTALANVENATTIDELKNILITLKNSI